MLKGCRYGNIKKFQMLDKDLASTWISSKKMFEVGKMGQLPIPHLGTTCMTIQNEEVDYPTVTILKSEIAEHMTAEPIERGPTNLNISPGRPINPETI